MINSFGHYVHFGHSKGCFMPKTLPETSMPEAPNIAHPALHPMYRTSTRMFEYTRTYARCSIHVLVM